MKPDLAARAEAFRALHRRGNPVLLPNAWDAASARAVADAGFAAVATTSAGVAESLGFADHQGAPADEMFAALKRIARAVDVPVTADLEAGYGLSATELVERLLDAGAIGCNLEDTDHARHAQRDAEQHATFLAEVKAAGKKRGVDLVLNARTDAFLLKAGDEEAQIAESVRRAKLYFAAGADCVYPILAKTDRALEQLALQLDRPLNALMMPIAPPVSRMRELGYARVSLGSGLYRAAMAELQEKLEQLKTA